jgi:uncharacterized membrane protein YvbJ
MGNIKCVHCGKVVFEWAPECPYCKRPIANPHAPTNVSAQPKTWKKISYRKKSPIPLIIAGGIVIIIVVAAVLFFKYNIL